jgi:hypothetical protein
VQWQADLDSYLALSVIVKCLPDWNNIYKYYLGLCVRYSDPVVFYGIAIDKRIKGTPGITGWYLYRVHIEGVVWHLDVGLSHPGAENGFKGSTVRWLKAVHELGLERCETVRSLSTMGYIKNIDLLPSTRGPEKIIPIV